MKPAMKLQRTRQVLLGIVTGLVAVALAILAAQLSGFRAGNGSAGVRTKPIGSSLQAASGDVSDGFAALNDAALGPAPESIILDLRSMHEGTYADAKTLQDGMYLATNNGSLCAWVVDGFGQCTDKLNYGDVWLEGMEQRHYDSASAPFDVHLYGFARDGVSSIVVTTNGETHSIPVVHNAFRATIGNASFADIVSVEKVYASGDRRPLDTSNQFRRPPDTQAAP